MAASQKKSRVRSLNLGDGSAAYCGIVVKQVDHYLPKVSPLESVLRCTKSNKHTFGEPQYFDDSPDMGKDMQGKAVCTAVIFQVVCRSFRVRVRNVYSDHDSYLRNE